MPESNPRVVVVSGGTDGMGRALSLARAARGDTVVALGSSEDKGRRLLADAERLNAAGRVEFLGVDLSDIAATESAFERITHRHNVIDALALFANRQAPRRIVTVDGLEQTFALYYLSRYLLGQGLSESLRRSASPVIVNVAGTGTARGRIHWDDLSLARRYSTLTAQLQAGRANDLLGAGFAAHPDEVIKYVLYHPGFTKSGDLTPLSAPMRGLIRAAARIAARTIDAAIAPIHDFIDHPPAAPLTAIDRGNPVPLTNPAFDPANAQRLMEVTEELLQRARAARGS